MALGTSNGTPSPLYSRQTGARSSVLPLHNPQAQFRPRSALAQREELGRKAFRQARKERMKGHPRNDDDSSDMTSSEDLEMDRVYSDDGAHDDEETGLTAAERDKKRQQKKKRRRMDERVAGGAGSGHNTASQEEKDANRFVVKNLLINGMFIGLWYFFSISISLYNKWMFNEDKPEDAGDGKEAPLKPRDPVFPFPLFTTCAHMLVQFSLASLVMFLIPRFRPTSNANAQVGSGNERLDQRSNEKKPIMTPWFYLTRIAPCGLATGTDIGLGNMSLKFISLTFYTMCKSSVLGFVLIFAFIFGLEKPTWKLCIIITIMTIGVIMMVAGETAFNVLGFALVMTAAASSGFRWSLTQILLLRNPATSNPFSSIFFLAPVMFLALLIIAIPVEGPRQLAAGLSHLASVKGVPLSIVILIFPGCLAFLMTASEFALLQRSSVVTLSIAGIFKEVVTISAASLAFKDQLTPVNISGLSVTIACIALYNWMKISKMRSEARMDAHLANADYQPVNAADDEPDRHANGRSTSPARRDSTAQLIRNSLSSGGPSSPTVEPRTDNKISPLKRPEDHE